MSLKQQQGRQAVHPDQERCTNAGADPAESSLLAIVLKARILLPVCVSFSYDGHVLLASIFLACSLNHSLVGQTSASFAITFSTARNFPFSNRKLTKKSKQNDRHTFKLFQASHFARASIWTAQGWEPSTSPTVAYVQVCVTDYKPAIS